MAKEIKKESLEMTLEEAKAWRASLYKETPKVLSAQEKREAFRVYWASNRKSFGKGKEIESILWIHLTESGFSSPEQFEAGLKHFGLKKV